MVSVLDHGEVLLVDYMAEDWKVVDAARISIGKTGGRIRGLDAPENLEDKDTKLINRLMQDGHGTPFEHSVFQFYVKAPIFVVREWQRHRMASYNEFSMRYARITDDTAEFYIPDHVRVQDPDNKQSSIVSTDEAKAFAFIYGMEQWAKSSYLLYSAMLENGVAREMARMVLPVNIYTKFWFTVNARSLMNFLMLRNAPGAQWEIQQYAQALEDIFAEKMPVTHRAFAALGRRAP